MPDIYSPPKSELDSLPSQYPTRGVSRAIYWMSNVFIIVVAIFMEELKDDLADGFGRWLGGGVIWIVFIGYIVCTVLRLRNAGYNGWLAFLLVVPVANLWLLFCCFVYPPNYKQIRKFDRSASILSVLLVGLIILNFVQSIPSGSS